MREPIRFALNHMVAPTRSVAELFALAAALDVRAVELRNDLPGVAIADGTPARAIREAAERAGLAILSINALQRFNDWTDARAAEAENLAAYARACGARALVLCPVNGAAFRPGEAARRQGLRTALGELRPILAGCGVAGLVEPLGFTQSSLRTKREAVEAIDAVGGDVFGLVHDTFHHAVAGEDAIFPDRTGLVHVSGVEADAPLSSLADGDRVLVGPRDRLGNLDQIRRLFEGGYDGHVSFEPFAASVRATADVAAALAASMAAIEPARRSKAA